MSSAPAKLILCGEHAVVYGRPALAMPLSGIRAQALVAAAAPGSGVHIHAPDLGETWRASPTSDEPLSALVFATLAHLHAPAPDVTVTLTSAIPIASGMGSGAAIATALVRGLAAHLGQALLAAEVSALVYASEQRFHGTPSGIDNTVIAFEQPIWFQRRVGANLVFAQPESREPIIEPITIAAPFTLLIGDTGVRSATRLPVGEVRRRWQEEQARYESLFDQVADLVVQMRDALARGDSDGLGPLLNANHALLETIGVSSPELERLVAAARAAGAAGAKLSGAGWGGVMLALVDASTSDRVAQALRQAGAVRVLETRVGA
ncbi:MAG: mevalonate kinase [Chloroflexaceae bacterium]|jgi:mevalonate kinase|nr:mevalonate kinase [Chloroflexaceae bacterium]